MKTRNKNIIKYIFRLILFLLILTDPIQTQESDSKITEAIFYVGYGKLFSYNHGFNSLLDITDYHKTTFSSSHNISFGVIEEANKFHNFFMGGEISFIFNNSEIKFNDSIVVAYPPISINLSIPILYSIHLGEQIYFNPTIKPGFVYGGINIQNENVHIDDKVNINEFLLENRQKSKSINSIGVSIFLGFSFEYVYIIPNRNDAHLHDIAGLSYFNDRRANLKRNPCFGLEFGFATSSVSWAGGGSDIVDLSNYLFKGFLVNAYLKF